MPTLANNRKAFHDFSVDDSIEAGIVLSGHEVKSVRGGNVSLAGAYVTVRGGEVYLRHAHIGKYKQAGELPGHDETRERKLLLNKKEILELQDVMKQKGATLVPLEIYTRKRRLKLKIGIGRGKKQFDKRDSIKKRDTKRETDRMIRSKI